MKCESRFILIGTFVGVATLAGIAAPARPAAGSLGTLELSMGYAKCSAPLGASEDELGGSVSVGFAYWRSISPMFSWGAELSMDDLGRAVAETYDALSGTTFHEEFTTRIVRVHPSLRVNLGATVGPSFFAQGGAGLYRISWDYSADNGLFGFQSDDASSEFGFNVGAGLGFPVGPRTRLNVIGTYQVVPGNSLENMDNTNNAQIRAGLGVDL
jgi:opacity protein-like surface antigen